MPQERRPRSGRVDKLQQAQRFDLTLPSRDRAEQEKARRGAGKSIDEVVVGIVPEQLVGFVDDDEIPLDLMKTCLMVARRGL